MDVVILHNAVAADASAADRDVLVQAEAIAGALARLGHRWQLLPCTLDLETVRRQLAELQPDVVFQLVESLAGCDQLAALAPALLDHLGIPYTGAPTTALLWTNHKLLCKRRLRLAGLPTPDWFALERESHAGEEFDGANPGAAHPSADTPGVWILKAIGEHASFELEDDAVIRTSTAEELSGAIVARTHRLGRPCFAERFIDGREFNLSLLAAPQGVEVLPPAEIDFSAFPPNTPRLVGARAKWDESSFEFQHTPRRFEFSQADVPLLQELCRLATGCWQLFGLAGYARVDFRVDAWGRPWILEINANPCLSPDAGFAAALARAGIPFEQAVQRILDDATIAGKSAAVSPSHA